MRVCERERDRERGTECFLSECVGGTLPIVCERGCVCVCVCVCVSMCVGVHFGYMRGRHLRWCVCVFCVFLCASSEYVSVCRVVDCVCRLLVSVCVLACSREREESVNEIESVCVCVCVCVRACVRACSRELKTKRARMGHNDVRQE